MLRPALLLFLCATPLLWGEDKESSTTQLTPTLDLLPDGSTLKNVRIPRYDEKKQPAALLRASLMEVISKNYVRAEKIELQVFEPDGSEQYQINMISADYHVPTGVLEAKGKITIAGERFHSEGKGGIFQLDSRRGFLHGPVSTSFLPKSEKTSMHAPSSLRPLSALLAGTATLALAAPEPFTAAELQEYDAQTVSEADSLLAEIAPTRELNTRTEQLSQLASIGLESFANELNRSIILTALAAEGAPAPRPAPKADPDGLHVTCDGGMYFDAEKGHVVYLKNIFIKEPRFTMKAGKELKVFLEKKAELPEVKKKESKKEGGMKMPAFAGPANFADVKNIIATGGVEVVKKGKKGEPIRAHAATASYDAKTGDIVLRGDFPLVQQGKQFVQAKEAGLYIRVYENGDLYFQPGNGKPTQAAEELERNASTASQALSTLCQNRFVETHPASTPEQATAPDPCAGPRPENCVLVAEGLRKVYDRRPVVQNVCLHVAPGEVVGLLGPTEQARRRAST